MTKTADTAGDKKNRMYTFASWLQKSIRRGNTEDALKAAFLLEADGFGNYLYSRLRVISQEDIGTADMVSVIFANQCLDQIKPEKGGGLHLANAVMALSRAKKARDADNALAWVQNELVHKSLDEIMAGIPEYVYDQHTWRGKRAGRGMEHFLEVATLLDPDHSDKELKEKAKAGFYYWATGKAVSIKDWLYQQTGVNLQPSYYAKTEPRPEKRQEMNLSSFD